VRVRSYGYTSLVGYLTSTGIGVTLFKMGTTNPWNNAKKKPTEPSEPSFPGLLPAVSTDVKLQYEEIQEDELMVLESIYGEDFQRADTKGGAWKVR
jgi:hypothetical protein